MPSKLEEAAIRWYRSMEIYERPTPKQLADGKRKYDDYTHHLVEAVIAYLELNKMDALKNDKI